MCRVAPYIQNSTLLSEAAPAAAPAEVAGLAGDAKSVVVALRSGLLLGFSWQAKVRAAAAGEEEEEGRATWGWRGSSE